MQKIAAARGDPMSRFHNALYAGDVQARIAVLRDVGLHPLAYLTAKTNGLDEEAAEILDAAGLNEADVDDVPSFEEVPEIDADEAGRKRSATPGELFISKRRLAECYLLPGLHRRCTDMTRCFTVSNPFFDISKTGPYSSSTKRTSTPSLPSSLSRPLNPPMIHLAIWMATELIYVLNLVRTKHDKTARRCAVVRTNHVHSSLVPLFLEVLRPVLLLALDDYFANPSQDCLARLFDAINSMDVTGAPELIRSEKLVMRASERKDIFGEKFASPKIPDNVPGFTGSHGKLQHKATSSSGSHSSEDGMLIRRPPHAEGSTRERSTTESSVASSLPRPSPPSDSSFSLGGSAVWVGDESGILDNQVGVAIGGGPGSVTSGTQTISLERPMRAAAARIPTTSDSHLRSGLSKDTHFFQTTIAYKGHQLPIKLPLATFPEEVGDYSLIQLIQTFSAPIVTVSGPQHPHLHTNGNLTHPIIILFNALITGKRILFLGHNIPAGLVANYVLSACALGSGCGVVLRGFIERAFPYAGLAGGEDWVSIPAYIAGVTNPIFETSGSWDLLMDVGNGRVVVSKDIHISFPVAAMPPAILPLVPRTGVIRAENSAASEEEIARIATRDGNQSNQKSDISARPDSLDNLFIEDLISAITSHFGETLVRLRFTEYVSRFVRLAARYEEVATGSTALGFPSAPFSEGSLGKGVVFSDETVAARELATNASRIEGWRRTKSHQYSTIDFQKHCATDAIQGFDLLHQLYRLRLVKNIFDDPAYPRSPNLSNSHASIYDEMVLPLTWALDVEEYLLRVSELLFRNRLTVNLNVVEIIDQVRINVVMFRSPQLDCSLASFK
ncbi:stabilization of polarity axis-domain-containing protein, partial [Chiua virens]